MPQPGRFCFRCAQAFIPKRWSKKPQKYCGQYCRDSPNSYYFDANLGFWRNYNWAHSYDVMGHEMLYDDQGEQIITWEEKAQPEELMSDEEYLIFQESGAVPGRLLDYDDMISPVLDTPLEEASQ